MELIRGEVDEEDGPVDLKSIDIAWSNYVRFLFEPHNVYSVTAMERKTYFYVAENKSVAYRDAPKLGEAAGRAITVAWLEPCASSSWDFLGATEQLFSPCDGEVNVLHVKDFSLAEISLAAGHYPPDVQPYHTDRDIELLHERHFLDLNVERFESRRTSVGEGALWTFIVDVEAGTNLEQWSYEHRDFGDLTKMSMARQLQLRDGLTDDERNQAYALPKAVLIAALGGPAEAAPPPPAAAAPAAAAPAAGVGADAGKGARGRGRGRSGGRGADAGKGASGRGRGRGRGRNQQA